MDNWDVINADDWEAIQDRVSKEAEKDHSDNPHIWKGIRTCIETLAKRIQVRKPIAHTIQENTIDYLSDSSSSSPSDCESKADEFEAQESLHGNQVVSQISLRRRSQVPSSRKRSIDCVDEDEDESASDFVVDDGEEEDEVDDDDDDDDDDAYDSDYSNVKRSSSTHRNASHFYSSSSSSKSAQRRRQAKRAQSSSGPCKTRKNYDKETTRLLMDWFLLHAGKSPEHDDKAKLALQTHKSLTQGSILLLPNRKNGDLLRVLLQYPPGSKMHAEGTTINSWNFKICMKSIPTKCTITPHLFHSRANIRAALLSAENHNE